MTLKKLLLTYAAAAVAVAAPLKVHALIGGPTTPDQDPASFTTLATSQQDNNINRSLSPNCREALQHRKFHSQELTKYLTPITTVKPDGTFFHHTTHQIVADEVTNKNEKAIFSFLRLEQPHDPFFYIASDIESSKDFGPIVIKLKFAPTKKVFFTHPRIEMAKRLKAAALSADADDKNAYDENVRDKIVDELVTNDPDLGSCRESYVYTINEPDRLLLMLALEEANVALIGYKGTNLPWYLTMGTWAIDSLTVAK